MSFPIPPSSVLSREPMTVETRRAPDSRGVIRKVKSVMPASQSLVRHNRVEVYQQDLDLPSTLFDGSGKKTARWEQGQCLNIKKLTLAITVELTGDQMASMLPVWFWFSRISLRTENGSRFCHDIYPEAQEFLAYAMNENFYKLSQVATNSSTGLGHFNRGPSTFTVYYPLENTIFSSGASSLWADNPSIGDILIDFYPANPFPVSSSVSADTTLRHVQTTMMIECDKVGQVDAQVHQSLHAQSIVSRIMCMPTRLEFTNQNLGGVQKTVRFDLDSLTGKYAFFTVYLLANGGEGYDRVNYRPLTNVGYFHELKTAGNVSLSGGAPIPGHYSYMIQYAHHFPQALDYPYQQSHLLIPLCDDCKAALHGDRSGGYLLLDGSRHHLDLTFPVANGPGINGLPQDTDYTVILYAWKFQAMHIRGKTITLEDC